MIFWILIEFLFDEDVASIW